MARRPPAGTRRRARRRAGFRRETLRRARARRSRAARRGGRGRDRRVAGSSRGRIADSFIRARRTDLTTWRVFCLGAAARERRRRRGVRGGARDARGVDALRSFLRGVAGSTPRGGVDSRRGRDEWRAGAISSYAEKAIRKNNGFSPWELKRDRRSRRDDNGLKKYQKNDFETPSIVECGNQTSTAETRA